MDIDMSQKARELEPITYADLPSLYRERLNYQQLAGLLAYYGYECLPVTNDIRGPDFIAYHLLRRIALQVQLKSRFTLDNKYGGRNLYLAFPDKSLLADRQWFLVPYDNLSKHAETFNTGKCPPAWSNVNRRYSSISIPQPLKEFLAQYSLK